MRKQVICSIVFFAAFIFQPLYAGDIALPKPPALCGTDLVTALQNRKSTREFSGIAVTQADLSLILWAAMGVNRADGKQTIPYAMGKQYLELYVASPNGVYRYQPESHSLKQIGTKNEMKNIGKQDFMGKASYILIIVADKTKVPNGTMEYAHASAGALAQNVYLVCAAKKLGTVIAAFMNTPGVTAACALGSNQVPLYIMPIGALK